MAVTIYPEGLADLLNKGTANAVVRVILLDSGFTADPDTQATVSDIVANEVSGTGYSSAARPPANNVTVTNTAGVLDIAGDNISIPALDVGTISGVAVYFEEVGGDAANTLVAAMDGLNIVTSGAAQPINFPAAGLITFTPAA